MRKSTLSRLPSALPRPGRAGFTLLELLIVIGIIGLLAGIIAVGMFGALGSTRDRGTQSRLEMLSTMLANHSQADQAAGGTNMLNLPSMLRPTMGTGDYYSTIDARTGDPLPATPVGQPISAPTVASPDDIIASPTLMSPEAARTQAVLKRLLSIPANGDLFASLPDDVKTLNVAAGGVVHYSGGTGPGPLDPPLLLDGHGGVILFVPEAGMTDMTFKDGTTLQWTGASGDARLVAADSRPFWVSAGADGSFATADDNVYSTQTRIETVP